EKVLVAGGSRLNRVTWAAISPLRAVLARIHAVERALARELTLRTLRDRLQDAEPDRRELRPARAFLRTRGREVDVDVVPILPRLLPNLRAVHELDLRQVLRRVQVVSRLPARAADEVLDLEQRRAVRNDVGHDVVHVHGGARLDLAELGFHRRDRGLLV